MPSIPELWLRSRGGPSRRVNGTQPPDSSTRRATKTRSQLGSRILSRFSTSSPCVWLLLMGVRELTSPLSGQTCNRYQHNGCGNPHGCHGHSHDGFEYPNDDRRYPSKCIGGTRSYFWPEPLGRCNSLLTNNRSLTTT